MEELSELLVIPEFLFLHGNYLIDMLLEILEVLHELLLLFHEVIDFLSVPGEDTVL